MRCPHCKTNNPPQNRFCIKCAQPLEAEASGATGVSSVTSSTATPPGVSNSVPNPLQSAPATPTTPTATLTASPLPSTTALPAPQATSNAPAMDAPVAANPAILSATGQEGTAYRPSGVCPPQATGRLLAATVLGALLVGTVYHFVARFIDFLLIFQLVAGFAVGGLLVAAIKSGKCRNPALATGCALIAAVLTYGTLLFLDSRYERAEMVDALTDDIATQMIVNSSDKAKLLDKNGDPTAAALSALRPQLRAQVEKELTPWETFKLYMELAAQQGVNITHGVSSSGGIPMKGNAYWLLLLGKIIVVGWVAAAMARGAAAEPFCERCDQWFTETPIVRVHPVQNALLLEKARAKDWAGLMDVPVGKTMDAKNHTEVKLARCAACADSTLTIESTRNNSSSKLFNMILGPQEGNRVVEARDAYLEGLTQEAAPPVTPAA